MFNEYLYFDKDAAELLAQFTCLKQTIINILRLG